MAASDRGHFASKVELRVPNAVVLLEEFAHSASPNLATKNELLSAPHVPTPLPSGKCAVYAFSLSQGANCPAGPNRALKVGSAGPNSNARFQPQHYSPGLAIGNQHRQLKGRPGRVVKLWGWSLREFRQLGRYAKSGNHQSGLSQEPGGQ
jgi:hypothetical protein